MAQVDAGSRRGLLAPPPHPETVSRKPFAGAGRARGAIGRGPPAPSLAPPRGLSPRRPGSRPLSPRPRDGAADGRRAPSAGGGSAWGKRGLRAPGPGGAPRGGRGARALTARADGSAAAAAAAARPGARGAAPRTWPGGGEAAAARGAQVPLGPRALPPGCGRGGTRGGPDDRAGVPGGGALSGSPSPSSAAPAPPTPGPKGAGKRGVERRELRGRGGRDCAGEGRKGGLGEAEG